MNPVYGVRDVSEPAQSAYLMSTARLHSSPTTESGEENANPTRTARSYSGYNLAALDSGLRE